MACVLVCSTVGINGAADERGALDWMVCGVCGRLTMLGKRGSKLFATVRREETAFAEGEFACAERVRDEIRRGLLKVFGWGMQFVWMLLKLCWMMNWLIRCLFFQLSL